MDPFTATMIRRATGLLDPILSMYMIDRVVGSAHPSSQWLSPGREMRSKY